MKILQSNGFARQVHELSQGENLIISNTIIKELKHGKLYNVQFEDGTAYIMGEEQILDFKRQGSLDIYRVTLKEYINLLPAIREHYRAFMMPYINFDGQVILENAYEKGASIGNEILNLYKCSHPQSRRLLLAGLIDQRGDIINDKYSIPCGWQLAQDVLFIARSLGYHAWYDGRCVIIDRWRVSQLYNIKVRKLGEGEYYLLKTDGPYLLDNFIVVG